jgi:hypothetical protein
MKEDGMTTTDQTMTREPAMSREPGRARAVFSTEDFRLLREAVMTHLRQPEVQDGPDSIRYSNLYHRLGRLD